MGKRNNNRLQARLRAREIYVGSMGKKGNTDDRLSALPDGILVNILDQLSVHEAARTRILSSRWSRLFAELSRLTVDARDFLPEGVSSPKISGPDLVQINAATVEATKNILACRNPGEYTIRLLSTSFYLRDDVPISIGHAVANAMVTYKIEGAEFKVLTEKEGLPCKVHDMENYGAQFVSFFNGCLDAFSCLTRLYLENLRFAESDFVSNIIVTCEQLKYLSIFNCETENWMMLKVEHAQLSELILEDCGFGEVELKWLPRLTRVKFLHWNHYIDIPLSFGHVPLLESVTLLNIAVSWHKMVTLSTLLFGTSVQELHLGFKCEKIWVQPECLTKRLASVFQRLRIVNLDCIPEGYDLTWTMFILEAAPSLEELCLSVMEHPCEMEMDAEKRLQGLYSENKGVEWKLPTPNFKHHHLTNLIIFCFESCMVSHVRRVMEAAVNLKEVYLYDRLTCDECANLVPLKPSTFPLSKKHRCSMRKVLTQGIESRARIHFIDCAFSHDDHFKMILH